MDPDNCLSSAELTDCVKLLQQYDYIFNSTIAKYNGSSGSIVASVNMGPTMPPQHKGSMSSIIMPHSPVCKINSTNSNQPESSLNQKKSMCQLNTLAFHFLSRNLMVVTA